MATVPHSFASSVQFSGATYATSATKSASQLIETVETVADEVTDKFVAIDIDASEVASFILVADGVVDIDFVEAAHSSITTNTGVSGNNELALVVEPATPANYEGGTVAVAGQRRTITTYGSGIFSLNSPLSPYPTEGDPVTIFTDTIYQTTTVANTPVFWHDGLPSPSFITGDVNAALITNDSGASRTVSISVYQDATP